MNLTAPRLTLIVIAAIVAMWLLTSLEPPEKTLRLARPPLQLDYEIALRFESLIEQHDAIDIEIVDIPDAGMSPVDAVAAGHADLAFATNIENYRDTVNVVVPIFPTVLHVVSYAEPMPEDFLALFRGRHIYAGPRGSVTRQIVREIADDMALTEADFTLIDDTETNADVIMLFAPIDRDRITSDPRLAGARLFSLGEPADIGSGSSVDRATLLNPRLRPFVIPVGVYGDATPEPVLTLAADKLLVAHRDLPATAVYDLFAEVVRVRTALFSERPELFQPLDKSILDANFAFSMHAGAMAYLQQDEPTYIERYSGVAEVLVTLLVGAVSGAWALINLYRIRRKNRIDEFYTEVIRIRDAIPTSASNSERDAAIDSILELQNRAFELLVAEQLAADESFRIFIELSNNSIDRIGKDRQVSRS